LWRRLYLNLVDSIAGGFMKTGTCVPFAVVLALTCLASAAFSQESVESTLARLNALLPAERHATLVKGAQSEKSVEWYATLPLQLSSQLITAFRQRYPFNAIPSSTSSTPVAAEGEWSTG
jgi:hypothetical protein